LSLVTRCPACGTVFRVVQDHLKVSDGWVRCGRCSEVFNAVDGLFDLERAAPAATIGDAATLGDKALPSAAPPTLPAADAAAPARMHAGAGIAPPSDMPPSAPASAAPATADAAEHEGPATVAEIRDADTGGVGEYGDVAPPTDEPAIAPMPEFVRRAERAERWRHPALRVTLWLLAPLLAAALAAQLALHYRDSVAARWPVARPWLQAACDRLGCVIEAPRRIDSLSVDSSGLVRVEGSRVYRLSVVLRNRADTAVLMPAIDLALTDPFGQTMIRRVLYAAELGSTAGQLPAQAEVALLATLDLGERRVSGYTLELFYP
jgi:predicted Zn finger-like uncharacterized protein